ncbi:MAG: hypothetical protein GX868_13795, partial [Actinobacteria bacterium]|nr:hypothetical protein [Actinomycetota bacterium]
MSDLFTAITDATELPTPPLRLRRIYLHGVGPAGARFDPLDLNLDTATGAASRVMLSLTNTGGKSTLIALVSSLIVPASREQISGRQIGDYLLSGDTGHVVCEWEDAMARTTYVTGVAMEWRDGRRQPPENQRSTTAMTRRWYGFRTGDALPGIDELPFVTDGHRTPLDRFVAALRETFAQHPTATGTIATTQIEWSQILDDHTNIDPVLFSYQMRMNDSEAGAEALLGSFNTPESVVRFFIDALSNGRDIAEFATRLTKYAAVAGQRPHLEAFAKFCAAVGPDIEAVVLRASEADEHAVAVRQADVTGAEHHAALVSRIGRDRTLLEALAQERSGASEQLVALRRDEGRVPDIRSQLRFERARADAAAAAQLLEEHKGRETAATLESEAWDAVEDLLALSLAESRRDSAKLALDAADEGLAPLRAATEAAAASYAARLATLISEARTAKGAAETTKQLEDQAFASHQRDERAATRHRTDAETNLRSIDEATAGASAAAQRATADGWIEHGERPSVAESRWVARRDADRAKLDELETRAGRAEVELDDANTQRRTLDKTLVKLRAAAQHAETKLGSFDADLAALSSDTATQLIGDTPTGPGDVARLAELALDAARDADRRAADHEQHAERAETELAHLDSTGMAAASPDVVEVQQTLLDAMIGASTGLEWIERNVANPDDREAFITGRPDL